MIMNQIISKILSSNNIGITFHISPDGDSLGSSLALFQALKELNKNCYIICNDDPPETFNYLPYFNETLINKTVKDLTDCVVVLDCGNVARIAGNVSVSEKKYFLINIDHHVSNDMYADMNFVDSNASSMGEIVYQMINSMGVKINENMAVCLYTSLITDTGSFRHTNTTSVTHSIAGDLINCGIDFNKIHRTVFENKKFSRVKLYGEVINEMYLDLDEKLCVMKLTKEMLRKLNLQEEDTSDLISLGVQIDSVEVAALFKEKDNCVKISLRSKSTVDVRKIAEKFDGGGHIRAAGLKIDGTIQDAIKIITEEISKELI